MGVEKERRGSFWSNALLHGCQVSFFGSDQLSRARKKQCLLVQASYHDRGDAAALYCKYRFMQRIFLVVGEGVIICNTV